MSDTLRLLSHFLQNYRCSKSDCLLARNTECAGRCFLGGQADLATMQRANDNHAAGKKPRAARFWTEPTGTIQNSTKLYSSVQNHTELYVTAQNYKLQCRTVLNHIRNRTAPYGIVPSNTIKYGLVRLRTATYSTLYCMEPYGPVWFRTVTVKHKIEGFRTVAHGTAQFHMESLFAT